MAYCTDAPADAGPDRTTVNSMFVVPDAGSAAFASRTFAAGLPMVMVKVVKPIEPPEPSLTVNVKLSVVVAVPSCV